MASMECDLRCCSELVSSLLCSPVKLRADSWMAVVTEHEDAIFATGDD